MDPRDKLEEFKSVSQFMRETLKEVEAMLTTQFTFEVCAHCLELVMCSEEWRIRVCTPCKSEATGAGWLIID